MFQAITGIGGSFFSSLTNLTNPFSIEIFDPTPLNSTLEEEPSLHETSPPVNASTHEEVLKFKESIGRLTISSTHEQKNEIITDIIKLFKRELEIVQKIEKKCGDIFSPRIIEQISNLRDLHKTIMAIFTEAKKHFESSMKNSMDEQVDRDWIQKINNLVLSHTENSDILTLEKMYLDNSSTEQEVEAAAVRVSAYINDFPQAKFADLLDIDSLICDAKKKGLWEEFLRDQEIIDNNEHVKPFKESLKLLHDEGLLKDWVSARFPKLVDEERCIEIYDELLLSALTHYMRTYSRVNKTSSKVQEKVVNNTPKKVVNDTPNKNDTPKKVLKDDLSDAYHKNDIDKCRDLIGSRKVFDLVIDGKNKTYSAYAFLKDRVLIPMVPSPINSDFLIPCFTQNAWKTKFYTKMKDIIKEYSNIYEVIINSKGRPQIQFIFASEKMREMQVKALKDVLKSFKNPLGKDYQIPKKSEDGKYIINLSCLESHSLLGFEGKEIDPLFQFFMRDQCAQQSVVKTEKIDYKYFKNTPIDQQRKDHEEAKKYLKENLDLIHSKISFIKVSQPKMPESYEIPNQKKLNPKVFSYEVTQGVDKDIEKAGQSDNDIIYIFQAASQFNGCEATGRHTIEPGCAVEEYKADPTQGPKAQLAFLNQVEIINCGGNRKYNAMVNVLNGNEVEHGYFTPSSTNIDRVNEDLKTNSDKMEFPCITSIPKGGTNPVTLVLTSTAAFAAYSLGEIDLEKKRLAQYFPLLQGFRTMMQLGVDFGGGTKKVEVKCTPSGLGAYGNYPRVVAKAFYDAAMEYEERLIKSNASVQLQIYYRANSDTETMLSLLNLERRGNTA